MCNSTSLAGLVKLDPNRVRMDDGVFEVVLLRMPRTALDLTSLLVALKQMQYDNPGIFFRHASKVTVETEDHIPWSLDGEYAPSTPVVMDSQCLRSMARCSYSGSAKATVVGPSSQASQRVWAMYCG